MGPTAVREEKSPQEAGQPPKHSGLSIPLKFRISTACAPGFRSTGNEHLSLGLSCSGKGLSVSAQREGNCCSVLIRKREAGPPTACAALQGTAWIVLKKEIGANELK